MGFIGQHDDVGGGIEAGGAEVAGLGFLDRGGDQIGAVFGEQLLEMAHGLGIEHRFPLGVAEGFGELLIELGAVGEEHELVGAQQGIAAGLEGEKHHGERLAGTLGGPDHTAAGLAIGALLEAQDGFLNRAELLIAGDLFDRSAFFGFEDGEVLNEVEKVGGCQQALNQHLLRMGIVAQIT